MISRDLDKKRSIEKKGVGGILVENRKRKKGGPKNDVRSRNVIENKRGRNFAGGV